MMIRQTGWVLLTVALAACSSPGSMDQASVGGDGGCRAVAEQRASDAGLNGYDGDMRRQIYAYTYQDCVKFRRR